MNKPRAMMMKSVFLFFSHGGNEYIGSTYSKQRNKRLRSGIFVIKKVRTEVFSLQHSVS